MSTPQAVIPLGFILQGLLPDILLEKQERSNGYFPVQHLLEETRIWIKVWLKFVMCIQEKRRERNVRRNVDASKDRIMDDFFSSLINFPKLPNYFAK